MAHSNRDKPNYHPSEQLKQNRYDLINPIIMRLWTYQHPSVLQTLKRGEPYVCSWEHVPGERWQNAFRWMSEQMAQRGIPIGEDAPVWAWHSVYRLGGKPDDAWADGLLFGYQKAQGIELLELEVPDEMALPSCYNEWNLILDRFIDATTLDDQEIQRCFAVNLGPRRGRPPLYFPGIQVCLPRIEPAWLVASERVDTEAMIENHKAALKKWEK
jgi:hypothetical protein